MKKIESTWMEEATVSFVDFDGSRAEAPSGTWAVFAQYEEGELAVAVIVSTHDTHEGAVEALGRLTGVKELDVSALEEAWREPLDWPCPYACDAFPDHDSKCLGCLAEG